MITKDIARLIYNCYSEIENGSKMIDELKKSINENGDFVLAETWTGQQKKFLELHIPCRGAGSGSYSVKQLPFQLAIDAIIAHIEAQNKELERLKEVCRVQLL